MTDPTADEIDILARTIYGEARNQPTLGKVAVANVVMNRVNEAKAGGRNWWGWSIITVCLKKYQFSAWNKGDPNRAKMEAVTRRNLVFRECLVIAEIAARDLLGDATEGSTHYMVKALKWPGSWGPERQPAAVIGDHAFYNDVD